MQIVHHPFVFNVGPLEITGFGIAVLLAQRRAITDARSMSRSQG